MLGNMPFCHGKFLSVKIKTRFEDAPEKQDVSENYDVPENYDALVPEN